MAIYNDRNTMLTTAASRITGASVSITNNFGNQLLVPKNSTTPYPQNIQLTAVTSKYFSPQYTWSYKIGTGSYTDLGLTTATINLTLDATWLGAVGTNTTVTYKVEVAETAGSLGINATQAEFVVPVIREGADGTSAWNNVPLRIYRRNTTNSAPELLTTGNSVYTFSSGVLIGIPANWSTTVPSTDGEYVFTAEYTAVSQTNSVTFANTNWSTPALFVKDGTPGATGNSGVVVYAYKRSATVPTDNPGQVVYSFTTNTITTDPLANSWSKSIPSGTDPLYAVTATASSNSGTDTILSSEWSNPVELVRNGTAGTNVATVYLYARNNNSGSAPAFVTGGLSELVFDFTQGNLSGTTPTNWYLSPPDVSLGSVLWLKTAVAFGTGTSDNIAWLNWSDAKILSVNGANGANGTRGSRTLYSSDPSYTSTYTYESQSAGANSYAAKATQLIAAATSGSIPTTPINGDTVTFSNGSTYVYTITHNGSSWQTPGVVIDGSLLVTGSVTAAKINSNGLTVRDGNGKLLLGVGGTGEIAETPNKNLVWDPISSAEFSVPHGTYGLSDIATLKSGSYNPWNLTPGTTVTLSADLKVDQDGVNVGQAAIIYIYTLNTGGNWTYHAIASNNTTTYTRKSVTFTLPTNINEMAYVYVGLWHRDGNFNPNFPGVVYAKNIKVEFGAQATAHVVGQPFKITAKSYGYSSTLRGTTDSKTGEYRASGLYLNNHTDRNYITTNTYSVTVLDKNTARVISHNIYNVYSDKANAAAMATLLNSLTSDHIVIVCSDDEPQVNRMASNLDIAMYRCGASRGVFGSQNFGFRSAYILVGTGGCGEGNGYEKYAGRVGSAYVSGDPDAFTELSVTLSSQGLTALSTSTIPNSIASYGLPDTTTFTKTGGMQETGPNRFHKTAGDFTNYSDQVYSDKGYTGYMSTSFKPNGTEMRLLAGINTIPHQAASFTDIPFCFFLDPGNQIQIYESGTYITTLSMFYNSDTVLTIEYDYGVVRYYVDGVTVRSVTGLVNNGPWYFDSTYLTEWAGLYNITVTGNRYWREVAKTPLQSILTINSSDAALAAGIRVSPSGYPLVWDTSGTVQSGRGVGITPKGIFGINSGNQTAFSLNAESGLATLANANITGTVNATSGNFSGTLQGANITGAMGEFTGTLSAGSIDFTKLSGVNYTYTSSNLSTETWVKSYTVPALTGTTGDPLYNQLRTIIVGAGGGGSSAESNYDEVYWGYGGGSGAVVEGAKVTLKTGDEIWVRVGRGGDGGGQAQWGGPYAGVWYSGTGWYAGEGGNYNYDGSYGGFSGVSVKRVINGTLTTIWEAVAYRGAGGTIYSGSGAGGGHALIANITSQTGSPTYVGYNGNTGIFTGYAGNGGDTPLGYGAGGLSGDPNRSWYGYPGTGYGSGGGGGYGQQRSYQYVGGDGANGYVRLEIYNSNSVVIRKEWEALLTELRRVVGGFNYIPPT